MKIFLTLGHFNGYLIESQLQQELAGLCELTIGPESTVSKPVTSC